MDIIIGFLVSVTAGVIWLWNKILEHFVKKHEQMPDARRLEPFAYRLCFCS